MSHLIRASLSDLFLCDILLIFSNFRLNATDELVGAVVSGDVSEVACGVVPLAPEVLGGVVEKLLERAVEVIDKVAFL